MPLPKSASIAARATEVYAETWDVILHQCWDMPLQRDEESAELTRLLPYLRQLLTCCACAGLLEDAMISLSCGHCYCHDCQFRPPILKIQCRQCRERTGLVIENQLRIVVKCYKHMCLVLADCLSKPHKVQTTPKDALIPVIQKPKEGEEEEKGEEEEGEKEREKVKDMLEFDPIPEILKEVQEGMKVSRAVLIVRPPAKYLKPPTSSIVKKDHSKLSPLVSRSATSSSTSRLASSKLKVTTPDDPEKLDADLTDENQEAPSPRHQSTKHKRIHRRKIGSSSTKQSLGETPTSSMARETVKGRERLRKVGLRTDETCTNSDDEIDVVSFPDSDHLRTRFNIVSIRRDDLVVNVNCLDSEYVNTSAEDVTVNEDTPTMIPTEVASQSQSGPRRRRISVFGFKRTRSPPSRYSRPKLTKQSPGQPRGKNPQRNDNPDNPLKPVSSKRMRKADRNSDESAQSSGEGSPREVRELSPEIKDPRIPVLVLTASTSSQPGGVSSDAPAPPKKRKRRRNHGDRPRCRCGTNNPQAIERICARNKCPCFHLKIPCITCHCRNCHNPNVVTSS